MRFRKQKYRPGSLAEIIRSCREPWYVRVKDRINTKVACLRGRHTIKFDSYSRCIYCDAPDERNT